MKYNFDSIISREGTSCEKYDNRELIFGRKDVIPLWIADMDYAVPPFITQAIIERANHPIYGYSFRGDCYHNAIIDWTRRRHDWTIERDWIDFTPGVVSGFVFAIRALTAEGDGVVIQPPVYPPFARMVSANERKVINNPLKYVDGRFEIDFEDLDKKLATAKAFLFCNPHNPTGRVFTREELERIGELCVKHDVYIISDEIHCDLVQKPYHHIHIASLSPELAKRTITLTAPSKTFNIAGLSTSIAITAGEQTRRKLRLELEKLHVDQGNPFGSAALVAAFTQGDEWLEQMLEYVGNNMDYVVDFLHNNIPSVRCYKSEATFLMWLDFSSWCMECGELMDLLVNEAHLGMNDGLMFGEEGRCFMRMNVGTSREIVRHAMKQLHEVAVKLGK